jgi:3-dehydrosphinganine reductase
MFSRNHFPVQGKAFIVTGGSLGLGRAIAVELAQRGASRILLVARGAGPLADAKTIVSRAATNSAAQVETFVADLTDATAACNAVKAAGAADDSPVDGVFCVAGTSRPGLFASLEPEDFSTAMTLNYVSLHHDDRSGMIARVF